ncbi:hypothetical protein J6590_076535 [Homalodisca vitripennis]|nr:hypothetical protein J6590_076535 [Homalodisca vitripennis]
MQECKCKLATQNQLAVTSVILEKICVLCQSLDDDLEKALNAALEAGYRLIDTAALYNNEAVIGKVLTQWMSTGKLERQDIFVTTKNCQNKKFQDSQLSNCMDLAKDPESRRKSVNPKKPRDHTWAYHAAGGQKRNLTDTRFLSWFARVFQVTAIQLFPVRGHSFSQYDRNFGIINKAINKAEVIGSPKPYLNAMVT